MRVILFAVGLGAAMVLGCEEPTHCADNTECGVEEVCVDTECVTAFGQAFYLSSASASGIPFSNPDLNEPWDMPGGLPDPYLVLDEAGGWHCTTYHEMDTQDPVWTDFDCPEIVINGPISLTLSLYDDDTRDDAQLIAASAEGEVVQVDSDALHSGEVTTSLGDIEITLHLTPVQQSE